jgi:hypothetical protein
MSTIRRNAGLIAAIMVAGMQTGAVERLSFRSSDPHNDPSPMLDDFGSRAERAPNGGRRHTVAQARRAALKRRNQLRHKRAMRGGA